MNTPSYPRLKFYGMNDDATYHQAERASALVADVGGYESGINEVLQRYNAMLFVQHGAVPRDLSQEQQAAIQESAKKHHGIVSRYFRDINDDNVDARIVDVDFQYHDDLIELLVKQKAIERCSAAVLLPALQRSNVPLWRMMRSKTFVRAYDAEICEQLVANTRNAELVLRKYLEQVDGKEIHLPQTLTADDAGLLIERYIESEDANPNYLQLIANSKPSRAAGITNKMRLQAKRAHQGWSNRYFEQNPNSGFRTSIQVSVAASQDEVAVSSMDGGSVEYTYSADWLRENSDYPTILNNFIYVFELVNQHQQLTLPSHKSDLGVMERMMGVAGRQYYQTGIAFQHKEQLSLLQVLMYAHILKEANIDLENVLAWFFSEYLRDEFGADNFRFQPSSRSATHLERCRHLFSEMDSVLRQFKLYVENGELDLDLLMISSEPVRFNDAPSLVPAKYVYTTDDPTIAGIQHLLFSDQSSLHYIDENRQADTIFELIRVHSLARSDFHNYQHGDLDLLIRAGILHEVGGRLAIADMSQFIVLLALSKFEAASQWHFSGAARVRIDEMTNKGWLRLESTLLSRPEAQYFNFMLNDSEFSNGPALRNNYSHGSQADGSNGALHEQTYATILKLLIALVLKINDDFERAAVGRQEASGPVQTDR